MKRQKELEELVNKLNEEELTAHEDLFCNAIQTRHSAFGKVIPCYSEGWIEAYNICMAIKKRRARESETTTETKT